MRTFQASVPLLTPLDIHALAASIMEREDVMDIHIHNRNSMRVITESAEFEFSFYTIGNEGRWTCNVYE